MTGLEHKLGYNSDLPMCRLKRKNCTQHGVDASESNLNRSRISGALAGNFLSFRYGLSGMGIECDATLPSANNLR